MDALEDQAEAQAKQSFEKYSWGLIPVAAQGPVGVVVGWLENVKSMALHLDGTWHDRPDRGLILGREDAATLARTALEPRGVDEERAVIREARAAFDRTAASMPVRRAPMSPETDWRTSVLDSGSDLAGERTGHDHGGHPPPIRLPR
jgi:hypothetical protein